jgi:hypothetical protein
VVGKVLDAVAQAGGIKNENNKPGILPSDKLHLFSLQTGVALVNSLPLSDFGPDILPNNGLVLLERRDSNEPIPADTIKAIRKELKDNKCICQ